MTDERYETNADGKWKIQGKARLLIEPSQEWLDVRDALAAKTAKTITANEAAEEAALKSLADPLVLRIEEILAARGMAPMTDEEHNKVRNAAVYLSSRGKHGRAS